MRTHKMKVVVPRDHQITVQLPSDFPAGEAEVIVLASRAQPNAEREPFGRWLDNLLRLLPASPPIPLEALRRENLYQDD